MLKQLDFNSKVPLYAQLYEILVQMIHNGDKKPREKVWTEEELAKTFHISRTTIRQTMDLLVQQKYLYRKRGKGTFITEPRLEQGLTKCYSFTETMKSLGKIPSSLVISMKEIEADHNLSIELNILVGTKLWELVRIRKADNSPILYQKEFFLIEYFPDLILHIDVNKSLYEVFAQKYNIILTQAEESLTSILLDKESATILQVQPNSLGIYLERKIYWNSITIGFSSVWARGDKFIYKVYFN
ncbi:MAG: GntR family transcriptional regulator [Brevinema sp.]